MRFGVHSRCPRVPRAANFRRLHVIILMSWPVNAGHPGEVRSSLAENGERRKRTGILQAATGWPAFAGHDRNWMRFNTTGIFSSGLTEIWRPLPLLFLEPQRAAQPGWPASRLRQGCGGRIVSLDLPKPSDGGPCLRVPILFWRITPCLPIVSRRRRARDAATYASSCFLRTAMRESGEMAASNFSDEAQI